MQGASRTQVLVLIDVLVCGLRRKLLAYCYRRDAVLAAFRLDLKPSTAFGKVQEDSIRRARQRNGLDLSLLEALSTAPKKREIVN